MPRRTAAERHQDTAPATSGPELIDQLVAYHHPARQRILEVLSMDGPASVGMIAQRSGLAPGSVSHHLKPLHRGGFVEPAPELAQDTRASWWRLTPTSLSYDALDHPPGSRAREVVTLAERANDDRHAKAVRSWRVARQDLPADWRRAGGSTDTTVSATPEQVVDLLERLNAVFRDWSRDCQADHAARPDVERRHVLAFAHVLPVVGDARR